MKNQIITVNKKMLEVHKPSSQITCIYESKGKACTITPTQHDSMNYICYSAREQLVRNNNELLEKLRTDDDELYEIAKSQLRGTPFKLDLRELTKFIDKFETNTKTVYQLIKDLEDIKVTVGQFKQDSIMVEHRFHLLSRTERVTNSNIIKIYLEPELVLGWVLNAKPFAKMFLKIQTTLKTTYTRILYEICKDYLNLGTVTKDYELWKQVLHLSAPNISKLKGNYLNKSVEDINANTDIRITNIFGKKEKGINYMTVEFEKQSEKRLQELNLIEPSIVTLPFYNKSKTKLDNLIKTGYKVVDEEAWITTDIRTNEAKYDAENKLDKWIKLTPQDERNDVLLAIAELIEDCNDHTVYIKDYRLTGIFSQEIFTKNAKETAEWIDKIIDLIESEE